MTTVRFSQRFYHDTCVTRAGLEALGLFVSMALYAADQKMIDGRMDAFPFCMRDRVPKRALKKLAEAGLVRVEGKEVVLLHRNDLWSFLNPTPLAGAERKRVAAEVFARDGAACVYCGREDNLTLDHIIPRSQGGSNDARNVAVACGSCNSSKGDRTPDEWYAAGGPR